MNETEATANIVIALINNSRLYNVQDVAEAYKEIFKAVNQPLDN